MGRSGQDEYHRYRCRPLGRDDLDRLDAENRAHLEQYAANILIMEELTRLQTNLGLLQQHQAANLAAGMAPLAVEVNALHVGEWVLLTFPGELSVQIGLNIKRRSPHRQTLRPPQRGRLMDLRPLLRHVSGDRIRRDLFHLSRDPLPFRKVNYTRPGQNINTLAEADLFIRSQLEAAGWQVQATTYRVQPFRCDSSKPLHHWYSKPAPEDPFYDAANLEATWPGLERPEQIIQLISHKDSMSWIDSPGAHDNAVGTVANLELARLLPRCGLRRSVRLLFCNEEHTPWTSRFAAEEATARGDQLLAVLNVDSLDGKPDEEMAAGKLVHVITHSTEEGRRLAEFVAGCAPRHHIDLEVRLAFKEHVNDDDGMFIKAGFRNTVMNLGSWPYADSEYHLPGDTPDRVNIDNVLRSTQLLLAAILELDAQE